MKSDKRYVSGGKAGKGGAGRGTGSKLFLALVTFCNLLLSLILFIQRRQEVLRAVQAEEDGDQVKVVLLARKQTKS